MAKTTQKTETLEIRKAPKFLPFMITGTVLGAILGGILYAIIPAENRTGQDIFGYLVVYLAGLGFAGGTFLAVVLDWVSRARIKQVEATKLKG
jgi:uncharacterized membrane protein YfcA